MMRHRLRAVNESQIVDSVNKPPPCGFRAGGMIIHLCSDISFPYSSDRASLLAKLGSELPLDLHRGRGADEKVGSAFPSV